jgi:hypothetical protein
MRIDPRAFGIAAAVTSALLFVLCGSAVAIAPETTTSVAGFLLHADLRGMARTLSPVTFVGGLVAWSLGTGLTFALTAWLYNRLTGRGVAA